jgi:hypothetical protein
MATDHVALAAELRRILDENLYPMMSFTEICRDKIGRRNMVVRQYYPDLARKISRRYREGRKLRWRQEKARFCAEIKETARFLHERGVIPNHKTLKAYVSKPSNLRCEHAIKASQEIRQDLAISTARTLKAS